jgi:hypothetical protein
VHPNLRIERGWIGINKIVSFIYEDVFHAAPTVENLFAVYEVNKTPHLGIRLQGITMSNFRFYYFNLEITEKNITDVLKRYPEAYLVTIFKDHYVEEKKANPSYKNLSLQ